MTDKILIKIDNLELQLPASHIIVEKDEYFDLKKQGFTGAIYELIRGFRDGFSL